LKQKRAALGQPVNVNSFSDNRVLAYFLALTKSGFSLEGEPHMDIILTPAHEMKPKPIEWVYKNYLAQGMLHIWAGKPGAGKTTVALDFAARVSSGSTFPDGQTAQIGNILIWSGEDSAEHVLLSRLIAADADLSRIRFIDGRIVDGERRPFDPAHDLEALRKCAAQIGDVSIIIIDSIASVSRKDSHKNAETRRDLQPTVDLAKELNCAIIGIMHFTKGSAGKDPLERVIGSVAFGAVARLVYVVGHFAPPDGSKAKRVLTCVKGIGREGGGFFFSIENHQLLSNPNIETSRIVWGEPAIGSALSILDALEDDSAGDRPTAIKEAKEFLIFELADGPLKSTELFSRASQQRISKSALFRAKKEMPVRAKKLKGEWIWQSDAPLNQPPVGDDEPCPWD